MGTFLNVVHDDKDDDCVAQFLWMLVGSWIMTNGAFDAPAFVCDVFQYKAWLHDNVHFGHVTNVVDDHKAKPNEAIPFTDMRKVSGRL